MLDLVVDRREMKATIGQVLTFMHAAKSPGTMREGGPVSANSMREGGPVSPKPRSGDSGLVPPKPRSGDSGLVPPKPRSGEGG